MPKTQEPSLTLPPRERPATAATAATTAAAAAGGRSHHTVDRRRHARTAASKLTTIYLPRDGGRAEPVAAFISDFSATGLGMTLARKLTPGQRFQVDVREGGGITPLLYAVVRCEPWRAECYRVGAVLLEVAATAGRKPVTQVQRAVDHLRRAVGS
jgi:hypothetical protein